MPSLVRLRKYNNSTKSETGYVDLCADQNGKFYLLDEAGSRTDFALTSELTNALQNHVSQSDPHTQYIFKTLINQTNGVCGLGVDGKVSSNQLPSYVDDVVEYASIANFPVTGEAGKIYVDLLNNLTYRWSGSTYTEISKSLALGTTATTAAAGNHIHPDATNLESGFMSASDKIKMSLLDETYPMTGDLVNSSNFTLVNLSELSFSVVNGKRYRGELWLYFQTAVTTTGIAITLSTPTGVLLGICRSIVSTDGTAALYSGALTAGGDLVISTGVQAANTGFLAVVEFIFIASADGTVTPRFRSEINNSNATVKAGTILKVSEY